MNASLARILADANRHPEHILRRGAEDVTHLVFLDEWQRFAALKVYRREFFADASVVRQFLDRVGSVQARYAAGIAYPLLGGHENGRLYLFQQLLPGHSIADLVAHGGPLDSPNLIALGVLIASRLEFVHRHYGLVPSLRPQDVCIQRDGPHGWTVGFSDYDLRPVRQLWACPQELLALQGMTLLLHYLLTASPSPAFDALRDAGPASPQDNPAREPMSRLFRRLLAPDEETRPQTLAEFRSLLEDAAPHAPSHPDLPELPVSASLLAWIPDFPSLTDRFQNGKPLASLDFPASFDAWDLLGERASRVHILPAAGPDRPKLSALVQQCVRLAHEKGDGDVSPIAAVMSDPSCCLISEPPPADLNLWEIVKRRECLNLSEAVNLLQLLAKTVDRLVQKGLSLPALQPQNILLRPANPAAGATWWEDLSDPAALRLSIRPFPTNLLFADAPCLSGIAGDDGPGRALAMTNSFHPRYAFVTLAHQVVRCALPPGEELPGPLAAVFHQALSQPASSLSPALLTARLDKAAKTVLRNRPASHRPAFSCSGWRLPLPAYPKSNAAQSALLAGALLVPPSLCDFPASQLPGTPPQTSLST